MADSIRTIENLKQQLLTLWKEPDLSRYSIILIDDEEDLLCSYKDNLDHLGLRVICIHDPSSVLETLKSEAKTAALVISDFKMPGKNGLDLRKEMLDQNINIPFIILSGFIEKEMALKAIEYKVSAFLEKPVNFEQIIEIFEKEAVPRLKSLTEDLDLLTGFLNDAENLIEQIENSLVHIDTGKNEIDTINNIFGMIHTIKGSSGFFEPPILHKFCHSYEEYLNKIKNGIIAISSESLDPLLKGIDILKHLLEEYKTSRFSNHDIETLTSCFQTNNKEAVTPAQQSKEDATLHLEKPAHHKEEKKDSSIKVDLNVLDGFLQSSGEMTVIRNMLNKLIIKIERKYQQDSDINELSKLLDELHKINSSIQTKITDLRKVTVKSAIKSTPRLVKDLSKKLKKSVDLEITGDSLRVDTSVAEIYSQSVIHLIRNSLDHGIEAPDEREKNNKPTHAKIKINSYQKDDKIYLEITDDGRGIDPDKVKSKIISKGILSQDQIEKMTKKEIQNLIFAPGFSTASEVTDISGRGVGMSSVVDSLKTLGGSVDLESEVGLGTKIKLEVPTPKSVLIKNCLFCQIGEHNFAIPQESVTYVLESELNKAGNQIDTIDDSLVLRYQDQLIPLLSLNEKLIGRSDFLKNDAAKIILTTTSKGKIFGLMVNNIHDFEDTVIKPSNRFLKKIGIYSGTTYLTDGTVGLVIDIDSLSEMCEIKNIQAEPKHSKKLNINSSSEQKYLLFNLNNKSTFAIEQSKIFRIEEISWNSSESMLTYRNNILQLIPADKYVDILNPNLTLENKNNIIIVMPYKDIFVGLAVHSVADFYSTTDQIENPLSLNKSLKGNLLINEKIITIIDPDAIIQQWSDTKNNQIAA